MSKQGFAVGIWALCMWCATLVSGCGGGGGGGGDSGSGGTTVTPTGSATDNSNPSNTGNSPTPGTTNPTTNTLPECSSVDSPPPGSVAITPSSTVSVPAGSFPLQQAMQRLQAPGWVHQFNLNGYWNFTSPAEYSDTYSDTLNVPTACSWGGRSVLKAAERQLDSQYILAGIGSFATWQSSLSTTNIYDTDHTLIGWQLSDGSGCYAEGSPHIPSAVTPNQTFTPTIFTCYSDLKLTKKTGTFIVDYTAKLNLNGTLEYLVSTKGYDPSGTYSGYTGTVGYAITADGIATPNYKAIKRVSDGTYASGPLNGSNNRSTVPGDASSLEPCASFTTKSTITASFSGSTNSVPSGTFPVEQAMQRLLAPGWNQIYQMSGTYGAPNPSGYTDTYSDSIPALKACNHGGEYVFWTRESQSNQVKVSPAINGQTSWTNFYSADLYYDQNLNLIAWYDSSSTACFKDEKPNHPASVTPGQSGTLSTYSCYKHQNSQDQKVTTYVRSYSTTLNSNGTMEYLYTSKGYGSNGEYLGSSILGYTITKDGQARPSSIAIENLSTGNHSSGSIKP